MGFRGIQVKDKEGYYLVLLPVASVEKDLFRFGIPRIREQITQDKPNSILTLVFTLVMQLVSLFPPFLSVKRGGDAHLRL